MFNRHEQSGGSEHRGSETIIAQGVKVEGDFTSEGDVIIEGEVTGNVKTAQHLRIGSSAHIQADVSAQDAIVAGEVRGNLTVENKLELLETSVVHGDIQARVLSVAPGARVNGRLTMDIEAAVTEKRSSRARREESEPEPELVA